jgi:methyl-accepting chemotaxis protein
MSEQTRALREMTIGAQNVTKQIGLITRANREHSAGADNVLKALNDVRSMTQENTKSLWAITDLLEVKGSRSASRTAKGRTAKAGS